LVRRAQDLPDPISFYRPLQAVPQRSAGPRARQGARRGARHGAGQVARQRAGRGARHVAPQVDARVDDDHISSELMKLGPFPAGNLGAVGSLWRELDEYVAKQAYVAVLGYPTFPIFTSDRVAQRGAVLNAVYGLDWTSFKLK
jgi:hypothetical protein